MTKILEMMQAPTIEELIFYFTADAELHKFPNTIALRDGGRASASVTIALLNGTMLSLRILES